MTKDSKDSRSLLELSPGEARNFFFTSSSYCSFDLPDYFDFSAVLECARSIVESGQNFKIDNRAVGRLDKVNYEILNNKDGAYGWRPFQLVHPVLYADLAVTVTEDDAWEVIQKRFKEFRSDGRVVCASIPIVGAVVENSRALSISKWWKEVEQESIRLSLEYRFMATADIVDCYGALYTHSVSWALHGKSFAKKNRNSDCLGNTLDNAFQDMHNRQTNGIPQGNVISDLIAEIVLGYADLLLLQEIGGRDEEINFRIIRYRDDYRIFTNTEQDAKYILLALTKVLSGLNFKLNASKTSIHADVIDNAIKDDKLHWNSAVRSRRDIFKHLLLIRALAQRFPNSGSLAKALTAFRRRVEKLSECPNYNSSLIAVVVDIMYRNPRIYPQAASILSKLLSLEERSEFDRYLGLINARFSDIPNTGLLDVWIQRFSLSRNQKLKFDEALCGIVSGESNDTIWNMDWLTTENKDKISQTAIVDADRLASVNSVISVEETEKFMFHYNEAYV